MRKPCGARLPQRRALRGACGETGRVAKLTPTPTRQQVNHGPSMALVLRHVGERFGKPVDALGVRGTAARNALQRELEEVGCGDGGAEL